MARLPEPFLRQISNHFRSDLLLPKTSPLHELALHSQWMQGTRFRWLYDELRSAIVAGTLGAGARLPSTRSLAKQHGVGRGTVVAVFEQLVEEGYIQSDVGRGSFVRGGFSNDSPRSPSDSLAPRNGAALPGASHRGRLIATHPFPPIWTNRAAPVFRLGVPALDAFPVKQWSRVAARRLRRLDPSLLSCADALGWRPLRMEIAMQLGASRWIKCSADEVVITSGTQHSLDLIARVLLDPGDRVWMEDPGYPGATALFLSMGAEVIGIPVDDSGLDCDAGTQQDLGPPRRPARLAYVTPGCQFPLGVSLSLPRRQQLLDWARRTGAWIVEDDYDGEFRFSGRPLAALRSGDTSDCVIYVNSFNKSLFPTLPLGYLVVPGRLIDAFAAARSVVDPQTRALDQAILCDFICSGHMARHLRRMRDICAERIDLLARRVRLELSGIMTLSPLHVGLHALGWLAQGSDDVAAARFAAQHEVDSVALSSLTIGRSLPPALVLGVASGDAQAIRRGVSRLASALRELAAVRRKREWPLLGPTCR